VLHNRTDAQVPVALGRELAQNITDAQYIEYPVGDHYAWLGNTDALHGDIEEFVTGHRQNFSGELERVLATVLFTDIVESTRNAAEIGDKHWRHVLDSHDQLAQQIISKHRGILVKNTGDGILATFDGPGRAVRCALALGSATKQIGLPLRAGLHIPARSKFGEKTSVALRCMPPRVLWRNPLRTKYWCRAWSPTWSPAPA
jgi:hypothetical protein